MPELPARLLALELPARLLTPELPARLLTLELGLLALWRAGVDSLPERFEGLGVTALALVGLLLELFCLVASLRREVPAEGDFLGARGARRPDVLGEISGVLELAPLDVLPGGRRPTGADADARSD